MADEFSVYQFFPGEEYERVASHVSAEEAVRVAKLMCTSLGAKLGTTRRVIITDGGDSTVFEWLADYGLVFPMIQPVPAMTEEEIKFCLAQIHLEEVKRLMIARNKVLQAPLEPENRMGWEKALEEFRNWRKDFSNVPL